MSDDQPPVEPPGHASPSDVRQVGIFLVVVGVVGTYVLFVFCQDMWLGGVIPVWWIGVGDVILGIVLTAFPSAVMLRERVGRITQFGKRKE